MADGWSPPEIGQHRRDESCNNCRGGSEPLPTYSLMPRSFCPFVSGERRG